MTKSVIIEPLTRDAFAPFGDVIEAAGTPDKVINQGLCLRYNDLAEMDFGQGRAGISVFEAKLRTLPLTLDMMERHPEGSQAFVPMSFTPFLVIVAADVAGAPGLPRAFVSQAGQGVNYHRGTWHGVLTPLHAPALFTVIDRIGPGDNLKEHWFDTAYTIENET